MSIPHFSIVYSVAMRNGSRGLARNKLYISIVTGCVWHGPPAVVLPGWAAHWAVGVELGKEEAFVCQLLDVGGLGGWVAIGGGITPSKLQ